MSESNPTRQRGALLRGAPSCHAKASGRRRPREGSEAPLLMGAGVHPGCLGHGQVACVATYPN
eukprot:1731263-Alexandrium_andersonii.AAC.1